MTPKRAILYTRVSGDDRRGATSSIQAQLAECQRYCEGRGYQVVGQAIEEPNRQTSGADWLPELERVIALAPSGTFDVLVCREVDRLARNRFKQMATEIELERHGVAVEYAVGQFEDSEEGRLLKGLVSEFAEYERGKIRRRTTSGKLRAVQSGNVDIGGGTAPYGYSLVTTTDPATGKPRRTLVINEQEAAVVRAMFELYIGGSTLHAVREWLNQSKVPPAGKATSHIAKRGGRSTWSTATVSVILSNETYTGHWFYRKVKQVKDPLTGKRRNVPRPREEWLEVLVPAIIADELFAAAQQRRKSNKVQLGHQRKHEYSLGGMITCGHCGKAVSGITKARSKRRYYICGAKHVPGRYLHKCDAPMFHADDVEAVVWDWIKSLLLDADSLHRAIEKHQQGQRDAVQPLLAMIESSQTRLGELEGRKQRLITAYTSGVLELDELAAQKTALDKEIGELTQAVSGLRAESEPQMLSPERIYGIEAIAAEIRAGAAAADNDSRVQREIFRLLTVKVTLCFDGRKRWADTTCTLGSERYPVDSKTLDCHSAGAQSC